MPPTAQLHRRYLGLAAFALALANPLLAQNSVTIDGAFADWADEYCEPDNACDDFAGQSDAKGACIASNWVNPGPATNAYLRFDFDVTDLSGANTADGCWLVDVNQNGNVDRALCFSLSDPAGPPDELVLQLTRFFTCGDTTTATCPSAVEVASTAVCAANPNVTADRLVVCPGEVPNADTGVECSVALGDLGWTSGTIGLLQSCTYQSSQPNSNSSDCLTGFVIDPESGTNTPVELLSFSVD